MSMKPTEREALWFTIGACGVGALCSMAVSQWVLSGVFLVIFASALFQIWRTAERAKA